MIRTKRLVTSLMLVFALLAQPLAAMAQDKTLKSGGIGQQAPTNNAEVNIIKLRLSGNDLAEVSWDVAIPAGVNAQGFDVRVDASLSNGTAQTDSKSFGGNARSGSFKFNLDKPAGSGPKPGGGGTTGTIGPATSVKASKGNEKAPATKTAAAKSGDKTPRKFNEGNISGGGNTGNNNNGNGGGLKPAPTPKPTPIPRPTPPPGFNSPKPKPEPEPVRITKLQAFITAKFAAGNDLAAFSEFIQPTDAVTGEMKLKGARGNSLQAKKLIHLNSVARLATECPSGQECFDIIAEARGAEANGQFKVSAEVIFANGVRRNASRTTGNLLRPVRVSLDKIAGTQVANVLVNINGGGNREQFTKTDSQTVGILSPVFPNKK
jgi:hypothetical protein